VFFGRKEGLGPLGVKVFFVPSKIWAVALPKVTSV